MPVSLEHGRPAVPQNFIEFDRDQELLLPPTLREWLPDEHLAWFVIDVVAECGSKAARPQPSRR